MSDETTYINQKFVIGYLCIKFIMDKKIIFVDNEY